MKIENYIINETSKVFIIAELSANHNGSIEVAIETIKAAKRAGADCIKLQTYKADTITLDSKKDDFLINSGSIWDGRNLFELYQEAFTPWEWHEELFDLARELKMIPFSSPFDQSAVDFLQDYEGSVRSGAVSFQLELKKKEREEADRREIERLAFYAEVQKKGEQLI
jgi:pseudaminic acid synthase